MYCGGRRAQCAGTKYCNSELIAMEARLQVLLHQLRAYLCLPTPTYLSHQSYSIRTDTLMVERQLVMVTLTLALPTVLQRHHFECRL